MKKILTLLLIMALAVSVLASCDKIPGLNKIKLPWQKDEPATDNTDNNNDVVIPAEDADLKAAYDFVHNNVKDIAEKTNANYTVPGVAPTKNTSFTVKWEVSDERIVLQTSEDGTLVTVVVPEPGDADIAYTLKFTVTNAKGESLSREYNHIVPKFQVNTYAEYRAAKDGDPLVVEGVVYGIMSKAAGDAENSVFVQDLVSGGGYYVYQVSDETIASVALGQTVKVKGNKKAHYDLPEIVDATIEVTNTEVTTLTPTDITAIFKSVDNATDKDSPLLNYVGGYVTIKGVTLLEAGTNGYYYFELDGVKTYFRISSSSNCTTKDEETKIKNNFNNNFYHTADLTGIATLYKSGDEYWFNVMPLTGDMLSNFSEEMQPMPDDVKVNFVKDQISIPDEMVSTNPVTLPTNGATLTGVDVLNGVNISWALAETANATLDEGVLTAVIPESGSVSVTLTATISINNATATKEFTVTVRKATTLSIPDANAKAEEAGDAYTSEKYIVEGFIKAIAKLEYGNMTIVDAEGKELTVYGTYSAYGDLKFGELESAPKVGDKVVLYGVLGTYKGAIQLKNSWLLSWEHVYTATGTVVDPTCVAGGYTLYTCACGAEAKLEETNKLVHEDATVHEDREAQAPTCQAVGYTAGVYCTECKIWVSGHEEQAIVDCDYSGEGGRCIWCGLLNHECNFVAGQIVAPTCKDKGYTIYACDFEGCTETEKRDEVDATGVHKNEDGDAFCDYDCNTIVNYGTLEAPLTTTQADAVAEYFKSIYTDTDVYSEQKFYVTGTVTKITSVGSTYYSKVYITDGTTEFYIYSINLGKDSAGAYIGFTKGDVIVANGYIAYAYGTKEMTHKGTTYDTEAVSVDAHEHNYVDGACLATTLCSICQSAKGEHSWNDGEVTTAATCAAAGVKTYTCVCTATKTEEIAKTTDHSYTDGVCTVCGAQEGVTYVTVTADHSLTTSGNLTAGSDAANATALGLDSSIFTVASDKCSSSTEVGLNKDGTIRLYCNKAAGNGCKLTITATGYTIKSIKITFGSTNGGCTVSYGTTSESTTVVSGSVEYTINADSFTLQNTCTGSNVQVYIDSIEITYA